MRVNLEDLKPKKLMVATPRYGGMSVGLHTDAFDDLRLIFGHYGLPLIRCHVDNDSCIARARNTCVDEFLRSDCTHLLFWDGDVIATPDDVIGLLALAEGDKDVVCGLYPKKHIAWGKVAAAVRQGVSASDLPSFVGDMVFNPIGLSGEHSLYTPLEVAECGTGFMMIQRSVFERFGSRYPERRFKVDHHGAAWSIAPFIDEIVGGRFLTEDYNFCRLIRAIGLKVWVCPWMNLSHVGTYVYSGNPAAVSSIIPASKVA